MSKIDLSKAKVGDKFRTRCGFIRTYDKCVNYISKKYYLLKDEDGNQYYYHKYGEFILERESDFDLVEQVLDKTLDMIERDIRINNEMGKVVEVVEEEKKELQRRLEVVELADRIFFSERGCAYSFKECIEVAEHSVNMINQYLKEGKL